MGTLIITIIAIVLFYYLWSVNDKAKAKNVNQKIYTGKMFQTLEAVYQIEHTVKWDVFNSNLQFLESVSSDLISFRTNDQYTEYAKSALNDYKSKYYDHELSNLQNNIINSPSIIQTLEFHDKQRVSWFERYCASMRSDIESLKTEPAKEKRREKILDAAKTILSELNHESSIQYHPIIIEHLKDFGINMNLDYTTEDSESGQSAKMDIKLMAEDAIMKIYEEKTGHKPSEDERKKLISTLKSL